MNTQLYELSFQSEHFKIDSHFSLLPTCILIILHKNDKVFSLSITDVCGLTVSVTGGWGEQGWETENCRSSEKSLKNAPSPSRPVHAVFGGSMLSNSPTKKRVDISYFSLNHSFIS
jgi:hypothetical protein